MTDPNGNWASKEEQDRAYVNMTPDDYNEMCDLGFDWEEPTSEAIKQADAQLEAKANNIRVKYNLPAFGSLSKRVKVQETACWTGMFWMPDFAGVPNMGDGNLFPEYDLDPRGPDAHVEIVDRHTENQIYKFVPYNYVQIGERRGETNQDFDEDRSIALIVTYTDYWQIVYYDWGPPKRKSC